MKFRIISDLHLDVNMDHNQPYSFVAPDDCYVLLPGDISAKPKQTIEWLNKNIKRGAFVEGNHICYNKHPHSIQYVYEELRRYYSTNDSSITFIQDSFVELEEDIIIVGGTLWTDMRFYEVKDVPFDIDFQYWRASRAMNDYAWSLVNFDDLDSENGNDFMTKQKAMDLNKNLKYMEPKHTVQMFEKTIGVIKEVCDNNPNKKIIVMTHHAPTAQSINEQYVNGDMNHCYASKLENFILDRPNIKLWVHGHVHGFCDYMVGDCRVICNPRGYEMYGESKDFYPDLEIEI